MRSRVNRVGRMVVLVVGIAVAAFVGWAVFVDLPDTLADLLGVVLTVATALVGARIAGSVAGRTLPPYNVAEVAVEGPITRDGRGLPTRPGGASADDVVEQIERADDDRGAKALLLKLNTPGGQVVPADDIRRAAMAFDGPTVAYATDRCASGGYWIASGCDELWARDASVVGSVGVIGSTVNAAELVDRVGLSYERFAAGKYKDAGTALREITDEERAYLQGLVDDFYDQFVERVAEGRDLDADEVRETEARVYLGREAEERGLVDELGAREDVEERVEELLGEPVDVREFTPQRSLPQRLREGSRALASAFGAGVAGALAGDGTPELELR